MHDCADDMSLFGTSRHFAARSNSLAFGSRRTLPEFYETRPSLQRKVPDTRHPMSQALAA